MIGNYLATTQFTNLKSEFTKEDSRLNEIRLNDQKILKFGHTILKNFKIQFSKLYKN